MFTTPKTVVVAEDELLIRMLAAEVLTEAGFKVIEAIHAREALRVFDAQAVSIHVLVTDIYMPGVMNGLELAHHVRGHWPWIGLLVVSGNPRPSANELPRGCRFLPKPYDPEHVVDHVRELISV